MSRHTKGQGVAQDYIKAAKWYRLAADQGWATAQNNLGVLYDKGQGVDQDDVEAARWWRLAADQGWARAQYNLGVMYAKGHGVPKDYVMAYKWWSLAAAQGLELAAKTRDRVAEMMTPYMIGEAQSLARDWRVKGE